MAGAYVQHDVDSVTSGDPVCTLTGVTAGNCLVVVAGWGAYTSDSLTITDITSDNGGALTQAVLEAGNNWSNGCIYYKENCNSGTHNVTVNFNNTASHYGQALLFEMSGLATSSVLEAANSAYNSFAASVGSGNVVSAQACTYIGGGTHNSSTVSLSHSLSGGTEIAENTDSSSFMPYSVVASYSLNGTYANTFTKAGGSTEIGTWLAAFKEAAAGGGPAAGLRTMTLTGAGI